MMNEEKYILAELKRWLVNKDNYFGRDDVLRKIAEIEADAILGAPVEVEEEEEDE